MGLESISADPTGRVSRAEAFGLARATAVSDAYGDYLEKHNPDMAAWNHRIAEHDSEERLAFLLALHDKQAAKNGNAEAPGQVAAAIDGDRSYIAEKAQAAVGIKKEATEI